MFSSLAALPYALLARTPLIASSCQHEKISGRISLNIVKKKLSNIILNFTFKYGAGYEEILEGLGEVEVAHTIWLL